MVIFIMCAGNATRFGGVTKQLLPIGDTTILGRTLTLLKPHNVIAVTHHVSIRDYVSAFGVEVYEPTHRATLCDSILSTQSLWGERVVILLGDVIYSRAVLETILTCRDDVRFYGDVWEMFALSFNVISRDAVITALQKGAKAPWGKLRYCYRAYISAPQYRKETAAFLKKEAQFHYVDCWITRDCDLPDEYRNIQNELVKPGVLDRE